MRHILACAALAATVLLGGCAGSPIYRGMDAESGAFVSTSSPVVSVLPAEGYENVVAGYTLCRVPYENSMMNTVSSRVWFSLESGEGSQLVTFLAECSSETLWEVRPIGVDFQTLKVFYERSGVSPSDATVHVYLRPASMDPWTPLFASAGKPVWEGWTLVARYEWTSTGEKEKLVVEYREPAPELLEGMNPRVADLEGFIERSQKSFALGGVNLPVTAAPGQSILISDRLLAPVVGSVTAGQLFLP